MREIFGPTGRRWLQEQRYTDIERFMLDGALVHLDSLELRIDALDVKLREMSWRIGRVKPLPMFVDVV